MSLLHTMPVSSKFASMASRDGIVSAAVSAPLALPAAVPQAAVAKNMEASLAVPTFHVSYTVTTDALDALYKKVGSEGRASIPCS